MIDLKKYTELAMRTAPSEDKYPEMHERALQCKAYELIERLNEELYKAEQLKKWTNFSKPYRFGRAPQLDRKKLVDPKNVISLYACLGLMGEMQEVLYCLFGKGQNDESLQDELCGDLAGWYVALLVQKHGLDWEKALNDNVQKLAKRFNLPMPEDEPSEEIE